MPDPTALLERVSRLVSETMNVEIPMSDLDLFDTGILDSLGFADLMARLEQEFGVRISIEDLEIENFRSVERIAAFIDGQVAAVGSNWFVAEESRNSVSLPSNGTTQR